MSDLAIIIPTLGRSELLGPLAANLVETTPSGAVVVYWIADPDDHATLDALAKIGAPRVLIEPGSYPHKTNAGVAVAEEEWALLTNDDVVFHPAWLEAALMHDRPGIDVIGTSDLSPSTEDGAGVTMPIVRRSYVLDPGAAWEEPGRALHEGYWHNYSETELWELANDRGVAVFEPASVIEHRHPDWGKRPEDETDRRGNRRGLDHDAELFEQRRATWRSRS